MNLKEQDEKERRELNNLIKKYKREGLNYTEAEESASAEFDWIYAGRDIVERISCVYIDEVISLIQRKCKTLASSKYDYNNMELYLSNRQYPYNTIKIFNKKEKMIKIYGDNNFKDCMRYIIGLKLQNINKIKNIYCLTTNDYYRDYTVSEEIEIYL